MTDRTTSDELRQLRDAVRGTVVDGDWRALAALGITAVCVPEELGGFGLHVQAAAATAEELGAALYPSPFAGITAAVHALAATDEKLVAAIVAGEQLCAFGDFDRRMGVAPLVDGASTADALVLRDRLNGELVLFADPSAWKVEPEHEPFDVTRVAGRVTVDAVAGRPLDGVDTAHALWRLLLAADAVGCVQRMLDRTVEYAGQRIAFGRPIGGFQAVQHRLADHAVRARSMGLLVAEAARLLEAGAPGARRAVAIAELDVSANALHVLHDLLQLTGGIGFTWEYGLHQYERRVQQDARLAANPRAAVRALSAIEGWSR